MSNGPNSDFPAVKGGGADGSKGENFADVADPFQLFESWYMDAQETEPNDPNAMALATTDVAGLPNVRIVLLKGLDGDALGPKRGFVFYTNLESVKGVELAGDPQAAVVFHWKSLARQVRVRGSIARVADEEADTYFASRPRGSQVGAWASAQSRPLDARATLQAKVEAIAKKYEGKDVPRPPFWSGFRLTPLEIEFWQSGADRLHDRRQFIRSNVGEAWTSRRLYP